MEFVPLLALAALIGKLLDFVKYLRAGDWNGAGTQATAWAVGVAVVFLFAQTSWADSSLPIGDQTLGEMNAVEQFILGLLATSVFSAFVDAKKAVDGSDSARQPSLFGGDA